MFSDLQTLANHEKFKFMLYYPDRELLTIVGKFINNCFQLRNSLVLFDSHVLLMDIYLCTFVYYPYIYIYIYIHIYIFMYRYTYIEALLRIYASVISVIADLY